MAGARAIAEVPGGTAGWRWLESGAGLAALWALIAICYAGVIVISGREPYDGDDLMRLQQVRDLLAGQSWFDVTQYRMNPPQGAAMHWSRLVDIPLAGAMLALGLVMPEPMAEFWASVLVPLLYLGAALALLRAIMLQLGFTARMALAGLGLAILFPLLPAAFAPMRIDHHSPQAVLALVCAFMLLRAPHRWAALCSGTAAAAWLVISLEGLPLAALLAALYGWRYAIAADRSLGWFLAALAVAAPALSLATRPSAEFLLWCDILLPAHWATFAAAAGIAFALPYLPRQDRLAGRLAALGLLPLICAPLAIALLGACWMGPFAALDPLVETYWYRNIQEGMPFWRLTPDHVLPSFYLVVLVLAGWWAARRSFLREAPDQRLAWQLYSVLTLGATGYGLLLLREMLIAQLLALPLALALLAVAMPRARAIGAALPRVFATVACLVLVTPAGAAIAGKQWSASGSPNGSAPAAQATPMARQQASEQTMGTAGRCDFASLDQLPPSHIFTTFNASPAVLARTGHRVEVGGYHRNIAGLRRVISAFIGDDTQARGIIRASGAQFLAVCLADDSLAVFARGRPDSLAQAILNDKTPAWLEPHPGFTESRLRVYFVR